MALRRTSVAPALAALDPRLRNALKAVGLAELIGVLCGAVLLSFVLDRVFELALGIRILVLIGVAVLYARVYLRARARLKKRFSIETLAMAAERHDPELEGQLLNALELPGVVEGLKGAGAGGLDKLLSERAVLEAERKAHGARGGIARALDLRGVWGRAAIAAVLLVGLFQLGSASPDAFAFWFRRNVLLLDRPWPRDTHFVLDREGTEWHHARKDPLEVSAWVGGAIPRDVMLRIRSADGERATRVVPAGPGRVVIPEEAALRGGIAAGTELDARRLFHILPSVTEPIEIRFDGGDNESGSIRVEVHDRPRILAVRFRLVYPPYLEREPGAVENPGGDIQVPAGTRVEVAAESDQELSDGSIRFGKSGDVSPDRIEGKTLFASVKPEENGFLELSVTGREWSLESRPPLRFGFVVLPDRPPVVSLAIEGAARVMTPIGKIRYSVTAEDDHGFTDVSLRRQTFSPNEARAETDVPVDETKLAANAVPGKKGVVAQAEGELDLAPLKLLPGTRLVLQAAASDNDGIAGPKTALSAREEILILDAEAFREEMEKVRIEAQNAIEDLARRENRVGELLAEWEPRTRAGERSGGGAKQAGAPSSPSSGAAAPAEAGDVEEGPEEEASEGSAARKDGKETASARSKGAAAKQRAGSKGSQAAGETEPAEAEASPQEAADAGAESAEGSQATAAQGKAGKSGKSGKQGKASSGRPGSPKAQGKASQPGEQQGKEQPEDRPPEPPGDSPPGERDPESIAREQSAIAKDTAAARDRLEGMVGALRQNQLIEPAEERRYRDEVERELEKVAEEDLPRSASEIRSLPTSDRPEERAAEAQRQAERSADTLNKVAERLAGSGNFREVLFRLERIIELQRKVIDETEKGVDGKAGGGAEGKSKSRQF